MKKKNDISGYEEIKSCISYIINKDGYKFDDNMNLLEFLLYCNIDKFNYDIEHIFSYFGIEILFVGNEIEFKELNLSNKLKYIAVSKSGNYFIVHEIKNNSQIVLIRNNKKEVIDINNLSEYNIYLIKNMSNERVKYLCNSNKIKNNVKELVKYKKSYLLCVLLSILFGASIIAISSFFQMLFDIIIPNKNNELFNFMSIYYILAIFISIIINICQITNREFIYTKMNSSNSHKDHPIISFFKYSYKKNTIIFFEVTSNIILIIMFGYIMHNISLELFLANLLFMIIYITISWLFIDKLVIANKIKLGLYENIFFFISMLKSNRIEEIYNSESIILKKGLKNKIKYKSAPIIYNCTNKVFSIINISFIIILGIQIINNDSLSTGYFFMFLFINLIYLISLDKLVNNVIKFQKIKINNNIIENIQNYYDVNYKLIRKKNYINELNLEIVKVDYKYNDEYIFNDVSMKIKSGRKIAIYGGISSGKTTFVKLLTNKVIVTNGVILINDININETSKDLLEGNMYILEPNIQLGEVKIRDIICGDKIVDNIDLNYVCKAAGVEKYIDKLPNKLDTIYKKGIFSSGQINLLLFARALLEESKVLILDNFIDALDFEHRLIIFESLKHYNGTVISMSYKNYDEKFFDDVYIIKNKLLIKEK